MQLRQDTRAATEQRPIGAAARKLLEVYMRRRAFHQEVIVTRGDVEFAGRVYLDVDRRRSEMVRKELVDAGGPIRWFFRAAVQAIRDGRIAQGRETSGSLVADAFFNALSRGTHPFTGGGGALDDVNLANKNIYEYRILKAFRSQIESAKKGDGRRG